MAGTRNLLNEVQFLAILIFSVIVVCVAGIFLAFFSRTMLTDLQARSISTADEMAAFLEYPLYYMDEDQAVRIAETFLSSGKVSGIILESAASGTLLSRSSGPDSPKIPSISRVVFRDGMELGTVTMTFSDEEISLFQFRFGMASLVIIGAVFLAIVTVNRFLVLRRVRRPLENIFAAIQRIADGNYETAITPTPYRDVNLLVSHVNDMAAKILHKNQEQNRHEEELKAKSEELDQYFRSSLDLLCIADTDGHFRRLNPEWERVLGYPLGELEGRRFLDLVHPDDVASTLDVLKTLAVQTEVLNFVNRYRCKDGSYRWIEWRSFPAGEYVYASARDITERKRTEEALKEREETFRNIVDASPMGMHMYQLHEDRLIFTGSNPAADRLLGANNSAFIGLAIEEAFPPLRDTEVPEHYRRAARDGESWHTEQIDYEDGRLSGAFEVYAFQMSPGKVAVLFNEITERKRAEAELKGSEGRARRQRAAISALVLDASIVDAELPAAIPQITKIVALTMGVARAGIWMLSEDGSELRCLSLYETGPDRHSQGTVLRTADFPRYFQALLSESRIHAHDAQNDSRTSEMTSGYLAPLGITSMLDAVIQSEGKLVGMVCLEHIGTLRVWKADEEAFASNVAAIVAQIMANDRRRKAELALRESEELQRSLLKSMPDLVVRTDMQGRIIFVNEYAFAGMESIPRESIRGESIFSFVAEQDRLRAVENARQRLEMDIGPQEYRLQYHAGPVIDAEINGALVRDMEGKAVGMVFVIRDISDRKRVEEELQQANVVVENSPAVLFRWKAAENWPVIMVSRNISQFGYQREELLCGAVTYTDMVHPDDVERMNSEIEHYTSNNIDRYRQEYRVLTSGGEVRWVDDRTTVIRGADGQVIEYQGIVLDITERKEAEKALAASRRMLDEVINAIPVRVYWKDRDMLYLGGNRLFAMDVGLDDPGELIGQDDLTLGWTEGHDANLMAERAVLDDGEEIRNVETRHEAPSGQIAWRRTSKIPLLDQNKQIYGILGVYDDISEYKRMQELMVQTEKMISVGGIAAGIAHEINNPLGIVLQASQNMALRMRPDFPKNQEAAKALGLDLDVMGQYVRVRKVDVFLEDIQVAAKRAATIIRQMLDFTRRSESRRTLCSPSQIVRNALTLVQSDYDLKKNYDFKKILIDIVEEEGVPSVLCTESEIEQVVLNVLRNAAQAMAEVNPPLEEPRIDIRICATAGGIRMELEDNGPGIPKDVLGRIFEPFFTTKEPGKGTGLGLSVSYFIITQGHGGRMFVESTPGEGTCFTIELPVSADAS